MPQSANILEQLKGIGSDQIFSVPAGYFENLAGELLKRVRALEAEDPSEELVHLSPFLNSLPRSVPYAVPDGYFAGLQARASLLTRKFASAQEELEAISPILAGAKKEVPFSVPEGYFEKLRPQIAPKVVPISSRRWFRMAAAAVITGVIVLAGFAYLGTRPDPVEEPYAWVKKNLKKVDKADLEEFVTLAEEETAPSVSLPVKVEEIKDLMKDVTDQEIQEFLSQIPEEESADGVLLN
ncbi:MAG TPA: hypothetical protein VEB63_11030 [Chitinophagaceae bacterium]|nr:hypothetical protein [Chitinophagaceae bacterium]